MTIFKTTLVVSTLILLFVSCKRNDPVEREFCSYDSSLIKSIGYTNSAGDHSTANYYYDQNNRLIEIAFDASKQKFSYLGDTIITEGFTNTGRQDAVSKIAVSGSTDISYHSDLIFQIDGSTYGNRVYYIYDNMHQLVEWRRRSFKVGPFDTTTADSIRYAWQDGKIVSSYRNGTAIGRKVELGTYSYLAGSNGNRSSNHPTEMSFLIARSRNYHPVVCTNLISEINYTMGGIQTNKVSYTYEFDNYNRVSKMVIRSLYASYPSDTFRVLEYRYKCI